MKKLFAAVLVLFLVSTLFGLGTTVKAQGRTIVVPDDYPTITSAVIGAVDGGVILLRNGVHDGPINKTLIINKSLSIIGESRDRTIVRLYPAYSESWILSAVFYTYTNALTIKADSCRLQNLTIEVANPGGYLQSFGAGTLITECNISTSPSTGVTLSGENSSITQNLVGGYIQLNSSYCQAEQNTAVYIYAYNSFNFIKDNTCQGVALTHSNNSVVLENRILSDTRGFTGVDISWGKNNFIAKNTISGFSYTFRLWYSDDNIIQANTANNSLSAAISFGASYKNNVYLNNFIDNPSWKKGYFYDMYSDSNYATAFPNMTAAKEIWTNGEFGNYWQDYQTNYPNITEIGNTGIGDTPYVINEYNTDPYPLVRQYDIANSTAMLPDWTNLSLREALSAQFPPPPQTSFATTPQPTVSEVPTTPQQTQEPTQPPRTAVESSAIVWLILIFVLIIAAAGVLFYSRIRKDHKKVE